MGKDDEQTPLNPGIRIDKGEPGGGEPASGSATQPMMSAHAGDSKHKFTASAFTSAFDINFYITF